MENYVENKTKFYLVKIVENLTNLYIVTGW